VIRSSPPVAIAVSGPGFSARSLVSTSAPNSNLNVAMAHLKFSPLDTVDAGIIYYDFHFDQPAQFDNPSITSKNAAQEVDFYSVWSATEW
jgi:hypothetical protein